MRIAFGLAFVLGCSRSTAPPPPAVAGNAVVPVASFARWTSAQAFAAFQRRGLDVVAPTPVTPSAQGLSPVTERDGLHFYLATLQVIDPGAGGRVFSFSRAEDLEAKRAYFVNLGRSNSVFFSWVFVRGNVLVQLNGQLPEGWAQLYAQALNDLP